MSKSPSIPRTKNPEGYDEHGKPVRVLVIDDELLTRRLVVQVLRSVGYDVVTEGENGRVAVQLYDKYKPDIVTMDVRMPVLGGLEALKEIKKKHQNATIVMLTNENSKDTVKELILAGASGYIVKPVDRTLVLDKLKEVRSRIRAEEDENGH